MPKQTQVHLRSLRTVKKALVEGGQGGQDNTHFKSSTNQTPRFARPGEPGRKEVENPRTKLLAVWAWVELPNAGKSALLSVVTATAKPKDHNYHLRR